MTRTQKLQMRMSEIREELGGLIDLETRSEEQNGKVKTLTGEMKRLEGDMQAAIAIDAVDAEKAALETRAAGGNQETRELDTMLEKSDLGRIFMAVLEHRSVDGVEGELQKKDGIASNAVPLDMLRLPGLETRAVTSAPADVSKTARPVVPAIFEMGVAAFLGIATPRVPPGDGSFPVLTTGATVHTPAKNAAAAESDGVFGVKTLTPNRLQASFFFAREDAARFSGMSDALRMNLNEALSAKLDDRILNKADGLLGTGLTAADDTAGASTYQDYIEAIVQRVNGKEAAVEADVRLLVGNETLAHMWTVAQAASGLSAAEKVRMISGGLRVGYNVPNPAGNKKKQLAVAARALGAIHAAAPIWSVTLIPDEVTKAGNGQIVITGVMIYDFSVLRADGFTQLRFQHVA